VLAEEAIQSAVKDYQRKKAAHAVPEARVAQA
jgi:hypothetical protein